jgi:hypothetical protein
MVMMISLYFHVRHNKISDKYQNFYFSSISHNFHNVTNNQIIVIDDMKKRENGILCDENNCSKDKYNFLCLDIKNNSLLELTWVEGLLNCFDYIYINLENREDRKKIILQEFKKMDVSEENIYKISGINIPKKT